MREFSAWVAAADAIERASIGDSFYLALFTGQRQTDRVIMRNESDVEGRHAFRQSKTGELVDIKEAPQLSARLNASHARIRNSSFGFNWIRSHPNSWSTRTMVSLTTRVPIAIACRRPEP